MTATRPSLALLGAFALLAACGDQKADSAPADAAPVTAAAAVAPAAATATAGPQDWTKVVTATPEGGFRMGNPNAPVRFMEFASFTCPHCRDFHAASKDALKTYVAGGKVSYEFRNFVLNGPDLAMSVLARCDGAPAFFPHLDSVFGTQDQWIQGFTKATPDDQKRLQALPPDRQLLGIADQGGLDKFYKLRGMPRAKYEACLLDKSAVDKLQAVRDEGIKRYEVAGTPTFVLNGETLRDARDWPAVDAAIKAQLR